MPAAAPPAADFKKPATPSAAAGQAEHGKNPAAAASKPGERQADAGKQARQGPAGALPATAKAGAAAPASGNQQRFDRMAVRAKLAVSEPGDAVEREADAVAERVMRMQESVAAPAKPPGPTPARPAEIKRKEDPRGKDARPAGASAVKGAAAGRPAAAGQGKRDGGTSGGAGPAAGEEIKRKEQPNAGHASSNQGSAQSAVDRPGTTQELMERLGPGEPLDGDTRAYFERRMGCDLGAVRIHTNVAAAQSAAQIQARAFTYGKHIAFASGEFQPQSESGKRLLAHELAHVIQQGDGSVARMIMRLAAAGSASASSSDFEVTHADLEVPPIKARHLGGYTALAGKSLLRRKGAYDASTRGTKQIKEWTDNVKPDINKIPAARRPSAGTGFNLNLEVAGGATAKVIPASSLDELTRLLQRPTWNAAGEAKEFQVDHMVEYQLGGADAIDNMELLNQEHNGSVGSSFSHGIKRTVREEIQADPTKPALAGYGGPRNAAGDPTAEGVMETMNVVFKKVKGRARESGKKEGGSMFWSKEQIAALDHVLPMLGGAGNLDGTATSFALLSPTGNLLIAQLAHGSNENKIKIGESQSGGMAGFTMKLLVLNPGYNDAAAGTNIGTLEGVLNFGPSVAIPPGNVSVGVSQAQSPGKYSGKLGTPTGAGLPNQVDFKPMSPLQLSGITLGKGVFGKATLQPSHPALSGLNIPAQIQDGKLGIFYTIDATPLGQKLKVPGLRIESAGITLGYDGTDFSVGGGAEFTIQKFGSGFLNASIDSSSNFELNGGFRADKRLFDQADMKLWYRSKGGFGGSGTLAITQPGKVKGLKSASLTARYEDSVFSATGNVVPDIPGLKTASLSVKYEKDELLITGTLGIDDKVPGVEKADITVTVRQGDKDWKVAASGDVTPKLPGLSGAKLKFSYDDGSVLVEGEFSLKKGPLDGKVTAGITNSAVDEKTGVRTGKGSGSDFKVFGAADIQAEFIKDKLDGKLKLRLLPDGSLRVGGGLKSKDFEVFGKYPKDGGEFFNKTFSTPPVPLPGLGFAVGSVSVGITFSASITAKAHASVGPGKLTGITVEIKEFDPAHVDFATLEIGGGGTFAVYADAGFGADAKINLIFGAAVAELVGSVGAEATAGIPADKPILSAKSDFTYSQANGLDISNTLALDISPELKFRLFGEVSARLNLLVDTVTVWKKDWTLAEAKYKLPIGIKASGSLGYNSKSGKIRPEKPADAIKVEQPKLDGDAIKGVAMGDPAPPAIKTVDKENTAVTDNSALLCSMPVSAATSSQAPPMVSQAPNKSVMPRRAPDAETSAPAAVDESLINRLGVGIELDLPTRGYFEQRMQADLSRVRIHSGLAAAREADRLAADAFTVGDHIAFAQGEYRPDTPAGQELIAHELAHVAQQQGGGDPIVLRWPAVTRTPAQTSETPASIRAMTLSGFSMLTESQLDWATSPALQADAAALAAFRDLDRFAERPNVLAGAGDLNVGDIITKGIPAIYAPLEKYAEGAATDHTAWLRSTSNINEAESWGRDLTTLEAAWPAANLSLVMRAPPNPAASKGPFEKLVDPAAPELTNFVSYLTSCTPVLSANDGSEVDSFLDLRREGALPHTYHGRINYARTYHHFTKGTLDGLVGNEAWPPMAQWAWSPLRRPLTVVLYPAVDDNGAFHRNLGLQAMVTSSDILTIVIEGHATVGGYQSQLAPVAARYGINGQIHQALIGGHGNSTVLNLAGSAGAAMTVDALGTSGATGANTTALMTALTGLMSGNPAQRRIVLDACLTNSHAVGTALRALPADAAADVNTAIGADPSLRDVVATAAGPGATVLGADASFAPSQTTFLTPGSTDIGLSVPGDPDLVADKLVYVEFGTEPTGCLRAVLECWARDQIAGTHTCRDAMLRRIGAGRSTHVAAAATSTWRESVIQPLYDLAANHYWGSGEAIRQLGELADQVFVLYMENHSSAAQINNALPVIAGNVAHVNQVFARVTADPTSTGNMRVAITLEQVWMQYNHARRGQFMTELARYGSCALASPHVDMSLVMPQLADLLLLPPVAAQLKIALLAARHAPVTSPPPSPLPAHIAYLRGLLGAGPTFPAAAGIDAALGPLGSEEDILAAIGRPLAGAPDPTRPPNANINVGRADVPDQNEFAVTPLRRNGVVATVRDDLMVRSRPTTATNANIFARLPGGTPVQVIGEFQTWYVIEQPGSTGFVAKRYITLLP